LCQRKKDELHSAQAKHQGEPEGDIEEGETRGGYTDESQEQALRQEGLPSGRTELVIRSSATETPEQPTCLAEQSQVSLLCQGKSVNLYKSIFIN